MLQRTNIYVFDTNGNSTFTHLFLSMQKLIIDINQVYIYGVIQGIINTISRDGLQLCYSVL